LKPVIAITIGDFNGVGPELALKAVVNQSVLKNCIPLLVGPLRVFEHSANNLRLS